MTYLLTSVAPKVKVGKTICGWERGPHEDFVLNEYSRSYLEQQQLAACHLSKLKFDHEVISQGDQEWSQYLEALDISSQQGIKLVTEAALLGSATLA